MKLLKFIHIVVNSMNTMVPNKRQLGAIMMTCGHFLIFVPHPHFDQNLLSVSFIHGKKQSQGEINRYHDRSEGCGVGSVKRILERVADGSVNATSSVRH